MRFSMFWIKRQHGAIVPLDRFSPPGGVMLDGLFKQLLGITHVSFSRLRIRAAVMLALPGSGKSTPTLMQSIGAIAYHLIMCSGSVA